MISVRSSTPATASTWDRVNVPIQEGFEILGDGTKQWCLSANSVFVANAPTWDAFISGYEY